MCLIQSSSYGQVIHVNLCVVVKSEKLNIYSKEMVKVNCMGRINKIEVTLLKSLGPILRLLPLFICHNNVQLVRPHITSASLVASRFSTFRPTLMLFVHNINIFESHHFAKRESGVPFPIYFYFYYK